MMNVETVSHETVKPSTPTPSHLKTYKISLLDQFSPSSYIPYIYFYQAHKLINHDQTSLFDLLKESFSETLAVYYPLSGRFVDDSTIDCNDEGGLFVHARVKTHTLSDFLKSPEIEVLDGLLPFKGYILERKPEHLVAVKLTQFECGGLVVAACLFHGVVDALSGSVFINNWAKITRGESIVEPDFTSASTLFPPKAPLPKDFRKNFDGFHFPTTTCKSYLRRYLFDETAVKALQEKAASEKIPRPSRVVSLCSFLTQQMAKAHPKAGTSDFTTLMVTHAVNLRQRIEPPLPENTFGNILWLAFVFYQLDDPDCKMEMADITESFKDTFSCLNKESLAELNTNEAIEALNDVLESIHSSENIKRCNFTGHCHMGLYDVDFGWGKPCWFALMGDLGVCRSLRYFVFFDSPTSGKGLEMWWITDEDELSVLEKHPGFLEYAIPNPTISI